MELTAAILGGIFAVFLPLGGLLFGDGHHRDIGIWVFCIGVLFGTVGGTCWYQERLWKKDAEQSKTARLANSPPKTKLNAKTTPKKNGSTAPFPGMEIPLPTPEFDSEGNLISCTVTILNAGKGLARIDGVTAYGFVSEGIEETYHRVDRLDIMSEWKLQGVDLRPKGSTAINVPVGRDSLVRVSVRYSTASDSGRSTKALFAYSSTTKTFAAYERTPPYNLQK